MLARSNDGVCHALAMTGWAREPEPDPDIEQFRDGLVSLHRDGQHAGYVATHVSTFTTLPFFRQKQWWVWLIVAFNDGSRHDMIEDYPPWTYVREMLNGHFDWADSIIDDGPFTIEWLPPDEAKRLRAELNIKPEHF